MITAGICIDDKSQPFFYRAFCNLLVAQKNDCCPNYWPTRCFLKIYLWNFSTSAFLRFPNSFGQRLGGTMFPSMRQKFSGATCAYIKRLCIMVFVVLSLLTELCSRFLLPHKGWYTVFIGKAKGVYKLQPQLLPHLVQRLFA